MTNGDEDEWWNDNPDLQVQRFGHDLKRQKRLLIDLWHQYKNRQ